jgi:hypothetical protein
MFRRSLPSPSGYSALHALKLDLHFNTYYVHTAQYYITITLENRLPETQHIQWKLQISHALIFRFFLFLMTTWLRKVAKRK